jgi:cytochrome P450
MADTVSATPIDPRTAPLGDVDSFDPVFLQEPHIYYERLRKEAPVFRDPKRPIVYVSTYDLVRWVNARPKTFSNQFGEALRSGGAAEIDPEEEAIYNKGIRPVETMLTADPPVHTRFRKLAMKAFTYKRVLEMTAYVDDLVNDLIDALPEGGCEFKSQFANRLPMYVIADALGIPRSQRETFEQWSNAHIVQISGVADKNLRHWAAHKIVEFQHHFVKVIEEKRVNPGDDVISDLVHADLAEEGDHRKMNHAELTSIISQLLVAGNETTAHTLTAGIYYLLQNPDQMARLKADASHAENFVEEVLRYLTPTNNMWRLVKEDAEINGVPVKAGELLLLRYGSANRDDAKFPDGGRFDMTRENARDHLAFGAGIHTCIGAQLARKEMVEAFPILLRRLENLRLKPGAPPLQYVPAVLLRGVFALHVDYDKRPRG